MNMLRFLPRFALALAVLTSLSTMISARAETRVEGPRVEVIADGFDFPEGPAMNARGELFVCDVSASTIYKIDPITKTKIVWLKFDGKPNGAMFAPGGDLLVADSGTKRLLAIAPDKTVRALTTTETVFHSPNDVARDSNGDLYFSDPTWDAGAALQPVYRVTANGVSPLGEFKQPNGVAVRNGKLYVAEGATGVIHVLDTQAPDAKFSVFARVEPWTGQGYFALDGMDFDRDGNLYVSVYGQSAIVVFNTLGRETSRITLPGPNPTNVEFSRDYKTLYVTEAGNKQLLRVTGFTPQR